MVDHLAHRVIAPAMRLTSQGEIVIGEIQPLGDHQIYRFCAKKFDVSPGGVKMGIVRYNCFIIYGLCSV